MKLIIDIDEYSYERIKQYYESHEIVESTYSYIYHGIPLNKSRPVIINEDGETAYLTQGHVDALLKYEEGKKEEWTFDTVRKTIERYANNDPV